MKRKLYIKPSITTVEIEAMSIMAGSIGDGGGTGNIGDLEPGYGGGGISLFHGDAERFHSAVAIGIGLHYGQDIHFLRQVLADDSQIVTKCIQIDFHVRNWHNKFSLQ